MDKGIKKMLYVSFYIHTHIHTHTHTHTLEYYSALKRMGILPYVATWINLEDIC